jgi:hypothetical protein
VTTFVSFRTALDYIILPGSLYLIGAGVLALLRPERYPRTPAWYCIFSGFGGGISTLARIFRLGDTPVGETMEWLGVIAVWAGLLSLFIDRKKNFESTSAQIPDQPA